MESRSWRLQGGLDLVTASIGRYRQPGGLIGVMNYEARREGYRRIDGYERYDGRKSPSDVFEDEPSMSLQQIEYRRAQIEPVPGTGDIPGVWRYEDRTYAIRKDSAGIVRVWRSGPTGWTALNLGHSCQYVRGHGTEPVNGESLSAFGITGTVIGIHTETGSWHNGTAEGTLVMDYDRGGNNTWGTGTVVTVGGVDSRTFETSTATERQLLSGADRWHFCTYNFFARSDLKRMYGVADGSGGGISAFEWDGTTLFPLHTGVGPQERPVAVTGHQQHLFIAYESGSVIHSSLGNPRAFRALTGAAEIGIGDEITGMVAGYRDILVVYGRNRTVALFGTNVDNWQSKIISAEAGAMPNTAVLMDEPVALDDRGLRKLSATEKFGDLDIGILSEKIRPLLDRIRESGVQPIAAVRVRSKSQYRVWFDDGSCIVGTYIMRGNYLSVEFTQANLDLHNIEGIEAYPKPGILTSVCSEEDSDARERIFFALRGSGYVYEMDKGTSFDGYRIQAYLRLPFNDLGQPDVVKLFKKVTVEADSRYESRFLVDADFADDTIPGNQRQEFSIVGPRSIWDEQGWSDFDWSGVPVRLAQHRISGRGRNVSILIASEQTAEYPHVFSGITILYNLRKRAR